MSSLDNLLSLFAGKAASARDLIADMQESRTAHRIVFIPWVIAEAGSVTQEAQDTFPPGRRFTHLHYQPWWQHRLIQQLSNFDEIYMIGHGHPITLGRDALYTSAAASNSGRLEFQTACDRLIRSGLRRDWNGDLKIFSCYSADLGALRYQEESLASVCASYLRDLGYVCKVYGYQGAPLRHRADDKKIVRTNAGEYVRASSARVGMQGNH